MQIGYAELLEILRIVGSSDLSEVTIEAADLRIHISRRNDASAQSPRLTVSYAAGGGDPVDSALADVAAQAPAKGPEHDGGAMLGPVDDGSEAHPGALVVTAPLLGTFYRAPAPAEPPFVEVGQHVGSGETLCLLEAMKVFMPLTAPAAGLVAAILAESGSLVEYGQPLMRLVPDDAL